MTKVSQPLPDKPLINLVTSEHLAMAFDPVAAQITFNALDPAHAQPIEC